MSVVDTSPPSDRTRCTRVTPARVLSGLLTLMLLTACSPAEPVPPIRETITHPLVAPGVPYVPPYQPDTPLVLDTLEPRTDLTALTPQDWDFYAEVVPGLLVIGAGSGTPVCYAPAATVQEYPDRVEVAMSIGKFPGAPGNCPAIGTTIGVRIHLTAPLAGRPVLDPHR